jgi:hypothetical protein
MGLVPAFAGYLALDHPNNRVCNIHICRVLVEAHVLGESELYHFQIAQKVTCILHLDCTDVYPPSTSLEMSQSNCISTKAGFPKETFKSVSKFINQYSSINTRD